MSHRRAGAFALLLALLSINGSIDATESSVSNTPTLAAMMSRVVAASRAVRLPHDEFAVFYFRPDGHYADWNLWLWKEGGGGARHEFSGVKDGVAFYRAKRALLFDNRHRVLNIIVRTDSWAKDPGVDQSYSIDNGARCVIFSGVAEVYAVGATTPAWTITRTPREPGRTPELTRAVRNRLPEPFIDGHNDWIDLYWDTWKFMHEKISRGRTKNGFVPRYIDEGFNENIYQWDSCFMAAYALYGLDVFPAMPTLDNFYNLQRDTDGYICRCYNEVTGLATGENDINPPLFAWIEWRYYRMTGDKSRLARVLPVLDRYFDWVKANARSEHGNGLYFITDLGSGMDNSPREEFIRRGAWIDLSSQQALAALSIARLAHAAGDIDLERKFAAEYAALKLSINAYLWNPDEGLYFDRAEDGFWHIRKTIASFWPMVAEIADTAQARAMIGRHLENTREFFRTHLFPTLSADDPVYDEAGHYWRGGVWAPTNYAVIKGLERFDRGFAFTAAVNHLSMMAYVRHDFIPDSYEFKMPALTEPNIPRNGDGVRQIWEAYAPDLSAPATRWDANLLVRQKFCGWSGLGPVALLIENVLGLDIDAPENTITWRINLFEARQGIRRLKMGRNTISLEYKARNSTADKIVIAVRATRSFRLVVHDISGVQGSEIPAIDRLVPGGRAITIEE